MSDALEKKYRMVYGVFLGEICIYIGSSACGIVRLEENHRSWKEKGYSATNFRQNLTDNPEYKDVTFRVLLDFPAITQPQIETLEGKLIRSFKPKLNVDMDPVASSRSYGRY